MDQLEDPFQLVGGQNKRVGGEKLDGSGVGIALGDLLQVFLDPLHRGHPKGHFLVHGAELALVVGAALGDLQQRPGGPVGISINSSCKMQCFLSFTRLLLPSELQAQMLLSVL